MCSSDTCSFAVLSDALQGLSLQEIEDGLVWWECDGPMHGLHGYQDAQHPESLSALLGHMLSAKSLECYQDPQEYGAADDEELAQLTALERRGLVTRGVRGNWLLATEAARKLHPITLLRTSHRVCDVDILVASSMSVYEVLVKLRASGWQWQRLPQKRQKRPYLSASCSFHPFSFPQQCLSVPACALSATPLPQSLKLECKNDTWFFFLRPVGLSFALVRLRGVSRIEVLSYGMKKIQKDLMVRRSTIAVAYTSPRCTWNVY